jgi:hypothetical protein
VCCSQPQLFPMSVGGLHIQAHGRTSRLRLHANLAQTGLTVNPLAEDVFLQIRNERGLDVLCAKIPVGKFMRMHGAFTFWDHGHRTVTAKGIDDMKITIRHDGSVRLRTHGRRVQMQSPGAGQLEVTAGFRDPAVGDGANRCSIGHPTFTP